VNVDEFDFIIIGAGPAGEAAAYEARRRNASVAIVDRLWFGGQLPPHRLHPVEITPRFSRSARGQPGDVVVARDLGAS